VCAQQTTVKFPSSFNATQDSGSVRMPFAQILPGPRVPLDADGMQKITFNILHVSNATLFIELPRISAIGDLSFTPAPGLHGNAEVYVSVLPDSIRLLSPSPFTISIRPVNAPPAFAMSWNVLCVNSATCRCTDGAQPQGSSECEPKSAVASLTVLEKSGITQVDNFATELRASNDYLRGSVALHDRANGTIQKERRQDARGLTLGYEYAVQSARSPKGKYMYVAEYLSDSVSVFAVNEEPPPDGSMDFIDRR
jgi:hypothetical protein